MSDKLPEQYLPYLQERDVDLLLLEEFHANPEFVAWFCSQLGIAGGELAGAWHSVNGINGETDLLVIVKETNLRRAILIENKIAAPEQPSQSDRYIVRGSDIVERAQADSFTTCMCAPDAYLMGLPPSTSYQHTISYELISDWFRQMGGARGDWRSRVLADAAAQSRRPYTMIESEVATAFHRAYWQHVRTHHPLLLMNEPGPKGRDSSWVLIKGPRFPSRTYLAHKLRLGRVDLSFEATSADKLLELDIAWPANSFIEQRGATATVTLMVPVIEMANGFDEQRSAVDAALEAMELLEPFGTILSKAASGQ